MPKVYYVLIVFIKSVCSLHFKLKRMREENGDKEEGKRCKSPPNVSAMKYTSWEKQGDLGNGGLDGLDHPGSNVNMSSPRCDKTADFK